ncbi:MAE_28990/MAE_18760 family HEPN-like nuclease, partial [Xanthomonas nasturtii]|uniref:MAE_28990/MAE_18760 family HEPN-like nuclease n=1 Tax=Xanthomonas nasturtii TaxID=1843581 RepID=UPI0020138AF1
AEAQLHRNRPLGSLIDCRRSCCFVQSFLRALWALLYAHYEGFYKFCWDFLLENIENQKVPRKNLKKKFLIISMSNVLGKLRSDISDEGLLRIEPTVREAIRKFCTFPSKLETKSNLWPNVARDNNLKVNFNSKEIDNHATRLKLIVSRRNDIAHGKRLIIKDLGDYQPYEDSALIVMHEIAVSVIECLDEKSYMNVSFKPIRTQKFRSIIKKRRHNIISSVRSHPVI